MPQLNRDTRHAVSFALNGKQAQGHAEPRMLLSDFLVHELGLTSVHVGCEHGVCGACTVRVDGAVSRACLTFAVQVDGRRVDTVESLSPESGGLNDLQQSFRRNHGLQCGYCTPGILMSLSRLSGREPEAERGRAARHAERPSLPLHRLCQHRPRGDGACRQRAIEPGGGGRDRRSAADRDRGSGGLSQRRPPSARRAGGAADLRRARRPGVDPGRYRDPDRAASTATRPIPQPVPRPLVQRHRNRRHPGGAAACGAAPGR